MMDIKEHMKVVGKDGIQRVFTVMAECAQAMKLEATAK